MSESLNRIKQYIDYKGLNISQFEKEVGFSNGAFASQLKNKRSIGVDKLENILNKFPLLSSDWVLRGIGEMESKKQTERNIISEPFVSYHTTKQEREGIPLIPISAVAGIAAGDVSIMEMECEYYNIPELTSKADYMIKISGNSMNPTYRSGDLVACKRIPAITFFQWGQIYVLDTIQGPLCKRVKPSDKGDEYLKMESDNPSYPPFDLPKSEIRSLALVVGLVRLE